MADDVLALQDVDFEYRSGELVFPALTGISLSIARGDFVAVVGASGSGKTTLMNLLGLMATPTSGQVLIEGRDTGTVSDDELAALRGSHIGFIFQEYFLMPDRTVLENILLPVEYQDVMRQRSAEKRAEMLMQRMGIADQKLKMPDELSGGQKQRAAICRALINAPTLILADEPTGALDSHSSAEVLDILEALNGEGSTVVVITHDAGVASRARRVLRIHDGAIVSDERLRPIPLVARLADAEETPFPAHAPPLAARVHARGGALVRAVSRPFSAAWSNFRHQKLRTSLTLLGIVVGVLTVCTTVAINGELRNLLMSSLDRFGVNMAILMPDGGAKPEDAKRQATWEGFDMERDRTGKLAPVLQKAEFRPILMTSADNLRSDLASGGYPNTDVVIVENAESLRRLGIRIVRGRSLEESGAFSPDGPQGIVLIQKTIADALFPQRKTTSSSPRQSPVLEKLVVENGGKTSIFTVAGVFETEAVAHWSVAESRSGTMILTKDAAKRAGFSTRGYAFEINRPQNGNLGTTLKWIENYLNSTFSGELAFRSENIEEKLKKLHTMFSVLTLFLATAGALSLPVGGINIMNIMLVTVTERTVEIGLRKAVGATRTRIRRQFLAEAVALSLAGGIAGIVLALALVNGIVATVAAFFPNILTWKMIWSPGAVILGLTTSFAVGVVFGFLPALRASRLDVVEAIRQE